MLLLFIRSWSEVLLHYAWLLSVLDGLIINRRGSLVAPIFCEFLKLSTCVQEHPRISAMYCLTSPLACGFILLLLRQICVACFRLFFHPLSRFSGPRFAAMTSLYKTYYEVFRGGELLQKIHQLHLTYGPVVRIGPNELHFNDYRTYHEIYSVESRFTKDPGFYSCFNASASTFGAIDPFDSKVRRATMHPFFTRRAIRRFEDNMRTKVNQLVHKLASRDRTPSDMSLAYRTATLDIITEYLFGLCQNHVNYPDFKAPLLIDIQTAVPMLWLLKSFPLLLPILPFLPRWLTPHIYDQFKAFCSIQTFLNASLDRCQKETMASPDEDHHTICHSLLNLSVRPAGTISKLQPFDEIFSLIQAGSDTVGNTSTVGTFYILNDKRILLRLTKELRSVWPELSEEHIDISVLQSLPYLTAVIKEALRLSHGFVTPLPRIVGPSGAKITGFEVPPKTIVGISATAVHLNSTLFPNPKSFVPERWLEPSSADLDRYLVSFSKGPRTCLGISMAWVELYIFFAYIFRKLDMELVETSVNNFTDFKDYFVPVYKGSLHVRAKLVE